MRRKALLLLLLNLLLFWLYFKPLWAYEITYVAHKQNIGMNYGEKRVIPVLLNPSYTSYSYKINIDGKDVDPNLRAEILGRNNNILPSSFSTFQGKDVMFVWDGKVYKYKEIYLLLDYYSPSSKNLLKKVHLEIYPQPQTSTGNEREIRPHILPSLYYEFNVHLNAFIPSSQHIQMESQQNVSSQGTQQQTGMSQNNQYGGAYEYISNGVSSQYIGNTTAQENHTNHINNTSNIQSNEHVYNNVTKKENTLTRKSKNTMPTGKITYSYTTTYLIIIFGVIVLLLLWKLG